MDSKYWDKNQLDSNTYYIYTLTGYKQDSNTDHFGPFYAPNFPPGSFERCHRTCDGTTYAYSLTGFENYNGADWARLSNYYKYLANGQYETRVYEYMTVNQFNYIYSTPHASNYWFNYYRLNSDFGWMVNSNQVLLLSNNNSNIQYKDRNGVLILDNTVYAVQKTMGKWRGPERFTDVLPNINAFCNPDFDFMVDKFNLLYPFSNYFEESTNNPMPLLSCDEPINNGMIDDIDPDDGESFIDCLGVLIDPQSETDYTNFANYVAIIRDCIREQTGQSFGLYFDNPDISFNYAELWPNYIGKIILKQLEGEIEPIELNYSEFFNENGVYIGQPFITPKGLYEVILVGENARMLTHLIELKENSINMWQQADFLNVNLFPNPITDHSYSLTLSSSNRDVAFTYNMYDANATLRESERFVLRAGQTIQVTYNAFVNAYPDGIMTHQFIFDDGSQKTVTGLKVMN